MKLDPQACYRAVEAKDARFDGLFFTCVSSTRIYCRCVCTAKLPMFKNVHFVESPAIAESQGFRPCLRCRPENAPGSANVDILRSRARRAARLIESGILENADLPELAKMLGVSDRQLRRSMVEEYGIAPLEFAQTYRALTAKRLLADTRLPIGEIAFASGFKSVRRLNTVFQERYKLSPSQMRGRRSQPASPTVRSELSYRPPFAWKEHLEFLSHRKIRGVEEIADGTYARTVSIAGRVGWLKVSNAPEKNRLVLELSESLGPVMPKVIARVKQVFDLDANPCLIAEALGDLASDNPGIRLPGAFDGFEAAVRAVLGQQVSVKFATDLAGRIAEKFGSPIDADIPGLAYAFPGPERLAICSQDDVASLGIIGSRARAIISIANEISSGRLVLSPFSDYQATSEALVALPGIGPWTAEYVAMRALGYPDAFPSQDLGVLKALNTKNFKEAAALAEQYRPWRAYAVMHLWRSLSKKVEEKR